MPFTWANVAPLGVSRAQLHTAAATGRITRLANGVYIATAAVPEDPPALHLMTALAIQMLRPRAIASHHTAALAWELDLNDPVAAASAPPAFIVPTGGAIRAEVTRKFSIAVRELPAAQRVHHPSGLMVTTPARAAVDVASGLALPEALISLDSAARLTLTDQVGSRRLREHYPRERSLAGARQPLLDAAQAAATQFTRRHLAAVVPLADPRRESPLESLSYGHILLAGLPLPDLQVRVSLGGSDAYPDFLWAQFMVIGEADGMLKYRDREDFRNEKRRQERLEQLGYRVVRWEAREIRERPAMTIQRIRAALDARAGLV